MTPDSDAYSLPGPRKAQSKKIRDKKRCLQVASIFKTLSHPQRLYIICCLCEKECTVSELQQECGAGQSVISQHLTRMRLERIVAARRKGNFTYYRIAEPKLPELIRDLERLFRE